jgi:hypothetical protein
LRKLRQQHLEEQKRRKAIQACSETKEKMDELEKELSNMVGLDELQLQLRKWAKGMLLDERRQAFGLKVGARRPPHMAFLGNPGTGIMHVKCPCLNYLIFYVYLLNALPYGLFLKII